jgi:hypothetical protein
MLGGFFDTVSSKRKILQSYKTNLDNDKFRWDLDPYEKCEKNVDNLMNNFDGSQNKERQATDNRWKLWYVSYSYSWKAFKGWNWFGACNK